MPLPATTGSPASTYPNQHLHRLLRSGASPQEGPTLHRHQLGILLHRYCWWHQAQLAQWIGMELLEATRALHIQWKPTRMLFCLCTQMVSGLSKFKPIKQTSQIVIVKGCGQAAFQTFPST